MGSKGDTINLFYVDSISKICPLIEINYLEITSFWIFTW